MCAAVVVLFFSVNWIYHVIRKPTELFFPVSHALYKSPEETWRTYAPLFRRHSTPVMSAPFLAALAQVEGSGNPVVRTYWRWSLATDPFDVYRPASSAVGMYQITDGTFDEARRYCIHDHRVVADGPWYDWRSCWFNALYSRVVPTHAIELTAAYLDRRVLTLLAHHRRADVSIGARQDLAAYVHLCGAGAADRFVRRGLRLLPGERCGDHDVAGYLARVDTAKRRFAAMAAAE